MDKPKGVALQRQPSELPDKNGLRRSDILAAFKLFDKDGSGTIDKSELYDSPDSGSWNHSTLSLTS